MVFIGDDLVVETHDLLRFEPGGGHFELLCVDGVVHVMLEQHLVVGLGFRDVQGYLAHTAPPPRATIGR